MSRKVYHVYEIDELLPDKTGFYNCYAGDEFLGQAWFSNGKFSSDKVTAWLRPGIEFGNRWKPLDEMNTSIRNFLKKAYEWDENEFEPQQGFTKVSLSDLEQLITDYEASNYQPAEHPFTPEEKEVMDALIEAHNKFCKLQIDGLYQPHGYDWVTHLHALQDILIVGATMRQYPKYFIQVTKDL